MKKITIILDEKFTNALTFTALGGFGTDTIHSMVCFVDLSKANKVVIDNDGKAHLSCEVDEE